MDDFQEKLPRARVEDEDGAVWFIALLAMSELSGRRTLTDRLSSQIALERLVAKMEIQRPSYTRTGASLHGYTINVSVIHKPCGIGQQMLLRIEMNTHR